MSTDVKLIKTQISKIIQSGGSLFPDQIIQAKSAKNVAISFTKNNLPGLGSNVASSAINTFERKISGKGAVRTAKGFLFIYFKRRYKSCY